MKPSLPGPELESARPWLARYLRGPFRIEPLAGDVSPRRYFRLHAAGRTLLLAWYPPEVRPACRRFRRSTRLLQRAGIPVPAVEAADCRKGLMLLEDLGPRTLYELLVTRPWRDRLPWYERALELVAALQRIPAAAVAALNPPLDGARLWGELEQTWRLVLEPRGLVGSGRFTSAVRGRLHRLCEELGARSPVPCHRDFMVRNLMPRRGQVAPAVLDHQDLRLGPPTYDLASLLNDSLFCPPGPERQLLSRWLPASLELADYHRAAAQRALKAVGTYRAFELAGSPRHVRLIVPTLETALRHLQALPGWRGDAERLREIWDSVLHSEPAT